MEIIVENPLGLGESKNFVVSRPILRRTMCSRDNNALAVSVTGPGEGFRQEGQKTWDCQPEFLGGLYRR